MRVTVSNAIEVPDDLIRALVRYGFDELNDSTVEVHVKAARPHVEWVGICRDADKCQGARGVRIFDAIPAHVHRTKRFVEGAPCRPSAHKVVTPRLRNFSGRAYGGVPSVANVANGTKWLVTLTIPTRPQDATFPYVWHYHTRAKTAGEIELQSWQEQLVHLAAHEHRHVVQFARNLPGSEVDAETYAHSVVRRFRQERARDWVA